MAASAGFLVYSIGLASTVFIVTNALMLVSAVIGLSLVIVHKRRRSRERGEAGGGHGMPEMASR